MDNDLHLKDVDLGTGSPVGSPSSDPTPVPAAGQAGQKVERSLVSLTNDSAARVKTHGWSGYKRGCRCDDCREGNRIACKLWRERRRIRLLENSNGYFDEYEAG